MLPYLVIVICVVGVWQIERYFERQFERISKLLYGLNDRMNNIEGSISEIEQRRTPNDPHAPYLLDNEM